LLKIWPEFGEFFCKHLAYRITGIHVNKTFDAYFSYRHFTKTLPKYNHPLLRMGEDNVEDWVIFRIYHTRQNCAFFLNL